MKKTTRILLFLILYRYWNIVEEADQSKGRKSRRLLNFQTLTDQNHDGLNIKNKYPNLLNLSEKQDSVKEDISCSSVEKAGETLPRGWWFDV